MQDRKQPDQLFEISPDGEFVNETIPANWVEFLSRFWRDLQTCKDILPWLAVSNEESAIRTRLSNQEAWLFLTEGSMQLVQAGIHIFLPAWWQQVKETKPKLKAKIKSSAGSNVQTYFGISQVMDFEWKLAIGSVELSEVEFQEILKKKTKSDQNQRGMGPTDASIVDAAADDLQKKALARWP